MAEQRWRAADILRLGVGEGRQLVYTRMTRAAALLTTQQAALLAASTSFRTLDEHAQSNAATRAELESLVARRLLVSEAAIRQRCFDAARQAATPPPISTIAVITRDRIDSLRRCLESYIDNGQGAGRSVEYLLVDTAPQPETRDLTRAMLTDLSARRDVTVRYAGLDERQRFADALARAGLPRPAIDFALFDPEGCDYLAGAARNAVQLATPGQLVLCADDDTVCRIAAVPGSTGEGLELSSQNDPSAMWFFPDQEAAMRAARYVDGDILAIHEELLGRPVASCLEFAARPDGLRVDEMDSALLRAVESGRARVSVTSTGMVGDAGSGMPPAIRALDPASLARLTRSDADYRPLALSRNVQRGVTRRTISNSPYFMAPGAAFDHRTILPPFFPVLRGQDNIFGFMLRNWVEGACIGHLPLMLQHGPAEVRQVAPDALIHLAEHPSSFELVIACIQSFSPSPGASAAAHSLALSHHLGEITSLAPADFEEFLNLWIWRMKALVISRLSRDLETLGMSAPAWTQDGRHHLDALKAALAKDGYLAPPDLATRFGTGGLPVLQRLLARFGLLLQYWPAMVEAAHSLAATGLDLAPPLEVR